MAACPDETLYEIKHCTKLNKDKQMKITNLFRAAPVAGFACFLMASAAGAATITYNTNAALTGFNNTTNNTLSSTSGQAATLVYTDNGTSTTGIPSNVNYGTFTLTCPTCTTQTGGSGASFDAFTFKLILTDISDNAAGFFLGSAAAGSVFSDQSTITITWNPLQLGPGTLNASSGNFGNTEFDINGTTRVVQPQTNNGQTTVQGTVTSPTVPEPGTITLIGSALIVLGTLRRRAIRS